MKTKIDFSSYLDLTSLPQQSFPIIKLDKSKYQTQKHKAIDFGIEINPYCDIKVLKETRYDPNIYDIETDDLSLYCASMFGGPLF